MLDKITHYFELEQSFLNQLISFGVKSINSLISNLDQIEITLL